MRDTSGGVLPGVTAEVASPALIEKVRSAITDSDGRYQIVDLRPGVYTVTFSLPGFNTVVRDGLELPANFTAQINAELKVGALEESITVTGGTPTVDVQSAVQQVVLSRAMLDAVPTGGRDTIFQVDGMTLNGLEGDGSVQSYFNEAMFEEVSYQSSAISAEVSAGGMRANMIPKDGGNTFKGTATASGPTTWRSARRTTRRSRCRARSVTATSSELVGQLACGHSPGHGRDDHGRPRQQLTHR